MVVKDIIMFKKIEKNNQVYNIQNIICSILEISLESISLQEQLNKILDLLLSIPCLSVKSKGYIYLVEDDPEMLIMKVHRGVIESQQKACSKISFGQCACGQAASTRTLLFTDRADSMHAICYIDMLSHGHYCVPILSGVKVIGVLCLYVKEGHIRNKGEEEFLLLVANVLSGIIKHKQAEEALKEKTLQLEESNTALKVLLKQREEDRKEIEENIMSNVKSQLLPCIEKLKKGELSADQKSYVNLLESKIKDIISPLIRKLSSQYLGLTPTEIRVADLIRESKSTKEIAEMLYLSESTINFHRNNLRNKLGLKKGKVNLTSYLKTLS